MLKVRNSKETFNEHNNDITTYLIINNWSWGEGGAI